MSKGATEVSSLLLVLLLVFLLLLLVFWACHAASVSLCLIWHQAASVSLCLIWLQERGWGALWYHHLAQGVGHEAHQSSYQKTDEAQHEEDHDE